MKVQVRPRGASSVRLKFYPGIRGEQGIQGSLWHSGTGAPDAGPYRVGDWYLNDANGDVYEKTTDGAWTLRDNLTGPQGPQGIQGIQGPKGDQGIQGPKGADGLGLTDGDKGDITVSASGATFTIDAKAVTNTKLADVVSGTIKGRSSAGSGSPEDLTAAQVRALLASELPLLAPGQCRLAYVSATQVRLDPFNGNRLFINGKAEAIPSAGVTLSNAGLVANTTYYVYAYMNAGTMTLEASATGRATDSTYGHQIKTGDGTRALVGMVRTNGSSQFVDSDAQRFVRSWFNDRGIVTGSILSSNRSTTSTTSAEIAADMRNEALLWSGERWSLHLTGACTHATAGNNVVSEIKVDGTLLSGVLVQCVNANSNAGFATSYISSPSEGYHYAAIYGWVLAGTGSWIGGQVQLSSSSVR